MTALKRVLRYIKGTIDRGIRIAKAKNLSLTAYIDSDWARDKDDHTSTSTFVIYLGNTLISRSLK